MRLTLRKTERLRSAKAIRNLYKNGIPGYIYPFRYSMLVTQDTSSPVPAEVLIAVSKRRLPRAVDRNLVRRRIREAYRTHKPLLYPSLTRSKVSIVLVITYIAEGIESWQVIEKKLVLLLQEIINKVALPGDVQVKD